MTKPSSPSQTSSAPPGKVLTVVGIGASAGGLEALQSFFAAVPVDSGMAFVVIQHLSPDHKSLMVELLSRKTAIPVQRAEDGMVVEADHIYLIPPKSNLTIFHGKLLLEEQKARGGVNLPVDIFFRSLAEDQGDNAVGVILSGTGSDGTRGIRAVKEWGGLVMLQDLESCKFDGMPRAAASTGLADFILPPEEMPAQLLACLRHPYAARQDRSASTLTDETGLTRLFSLLRSKTKVDFTFYKPSTITRRIERRIAIAQAPDLESYIHHAERTPGEVAALYRELLIGVTSFFRDPPVMQYLQETVLPALLERFPDRELRFWVAGCSTGEEAYTLAILIREVMENLGLARDVKIFATDIDREAISKAGTGIYSESIAADMHPSLLAKYFYCHGETYQVSRTLREMVVFAQHNLIKDPPFTRINLVSCRNLLIYLQTNLQQQVLSLLSFSLLPGGLLVLGNSETVGEMEDRFEAVERKLRIYRSLARPHRSESQPQVEAARNYRLPVPSGYTRPPTARDHERLLLRLLDTLASDYVPLAVVVNEQLEVLHTVGDASGIFTLPAGRAVLDISKMVHREVAIPLATGIQKVFRSGEEIVYSNIRFGPEETPAMRLRLRLLPGRKSDEPLVLVIIERTEKAALSPVSATVEYNLDEETRQRLTDLEQELQFTRENLQATIEELETSNEELQATNEELLASNEELQSTNEELQSTNEELYTVNAEYQNKIIEVTEVQNDVDNLLASSRIGTLILDEDLCIRRYSPAAASLFHLVGSDLGRPLQHLNHKLLQFNPVATARSVQQSNQPLETDVPTSDGKWYLTRVLPYRIAPHSFSGIVFTFVDISPLREMHRKLENSRQAEADIVQHMTSGLLVYEVNEDQDIILRQFNPSAERITGKRLAACLGQRFRDIWVGEGGQQLEAALWQAFQDHHPLTVEGFPYRDGQCQGEFAFQAFRLPGNRLAVAFEDVSERKQALESLRMAESFNRAIIGTLPYPICVLDEAGIIVAVNRAWRDFAQANGADPDDVSEGVNYLACSSHEDGPDAESANQFVQGLRSVLQGRCKEFSLEYPCHSPTEQRWFLVRVAKCDWAGPLRVTVIHENITRRVLAEAQAGPTATARPR